MASCMNLVQKKPISGAEPANIDVFTIYFIIWSHILSTVGDALGMAIQY
jgi:hypothetical protein